MTCRGGPTISSGFRGTAAPARSGGRSPRGSLRRRRGGCSSGRRLASVDTSAHIATFADGTAVRYDTLLTTIPLDALVAATDLAPALTSATADLRYSSTHVIGIGLRGSAPAHLGGKCWMYFPEDDCPFYRVTHFSHYSPNNVPDISRYWSLMAEVSESDVKPVDARRVESETVDGLVNTGLVADRSQVHHTWHCRLPRGYPTPSRHRDRALDANPAGARGARRLQPRPLRCVEIRSVESGSQLCAGRGVRRSSPLGDAGDDAPSTRGRQRAPLEAARRGDAMSMPRPSVVYVLPDKVGGSMNLVANLLQYRQADGFATAVVLTHNHLNTDTRFAQRLPCDQPVDVRVHAADRETCTPSCGASRAWCLRAPASSSPAICSIWRCSRSTTSAAPSF